MADDYAAGVQRVQDGGEAYTQILVRRSGRCASTGTRASSGRR
jgi:hypothetical protein